MKSKNRDAVILVSVAVFLTCLVGLLVFIASRDDAKAIVKKIESLQDTPKAQEELYIKQ